MRVRPLVQRIVAVGATALAAAAVTMPGATVPAAASGGGGPTAASVLGSGSDTTQFMMNDIDKLYLFSDGCAQIPTPSGPTPWLDFSCQSPDPTALSQAGSSVSGSPTITVTSTTALKRGQWVGGPGVPLSAHAYVGDILSATTFALSSSTWQSNPVNADATAGSGTFTFSNIRLTENYAHDQAHEAYFLGSGNGINQLCSQGTAGVAHIDFARSSRGPKSSDCGGLRFVAYARDGISWEAYNITGSGIQGMNNQATTCAGSGGVTQFCLSQAQLQGIYLSCTITNWSQVGGANVAIDPYTPQPGSGTRSTFDGFLGGSSDTCINAKGSAYAGSHIVDENQNTAIVANGDQVNAIFPFSFGVWSNQVNGAGSTILGAIDNVDASATTIGDGTFPYGRFLYNVYCGPTTAHPAGCASGNSSQQTVNYIGETGWLCKLGSDHSINPITGRNYHTDLYFIISTYNGFVPEPGGAIGGGVQGADYCRLFST